MDSNKETLATWNKIASLYEDKFMHLDLYNESYDLFCNSIKKDKAQILDIGCGPGNISKYLLSKRPDFNIHGIDFAPNMIKLAKRNNPTANFSVMDCRQISELKNKFDGIICGFCLPYMSQIETAKLISDSYKLLNENGFIYVSFVEGDPNKSGFQVASTGDRSYFYYHSLDEIKKYFTESKFEKRELIRVEYKKSETEIHSIFMAMKKQPSRE